MVKSVSIFSILEDIDGEISQTDNLNAYSRLLLLSKQNKVAKICYKDYDLWSKNLKNLNLICTQLTTTNFPEIIFPTHLIEYEDKTVGYLMPYIEGETFDKLLLHNKLSPQKILMIFDQLASVICRLPNNIHLGDLHAKNIIISNNNNAFLIDIDGFSIDNGYSLTCPLDFSSCNNCLPKTKYLNKDNTIKISKNTDILCLLEMFFIWLLKGVNPLRFSNRRFSLFLEYLFIRGVPKQVIDMFDMITKDEDNYLIYSSFKCFNNLLDKISYKDYLVVMNINDEENYYLNYINNIIKENKNG